MAEFIHQCLRRVVDSVLMMWASVGDISTSDTTHEEGTPLLGQIADGLNEPVAHIVEIILSHIAADLIIGAFAAIIAFLALTRRRSLENVPLRVLLNRTKVLGTDTSPVVAVPGFISPTIRIGQRVQGLPVAVRLVGLLDALALDALQALLHRVSPKENFELTMHDQISDPRRPLICVGGASVNNITGSVIATSLMQRGVWMQYPAHIARILGNTYRIESGDGLHTDYGFIVLTRNSWNTSTGCCLIFGIYPPGTRAAARVLEFPMRYNLFEAMSHYTRRYIWYRLFLDRVGIRPFVELEQDWVVVVKTHIADNAFYPGEPEIIFASMIPPIPEDTQGWSAEVQVDFWNRMANLPGWTGVAGDEPELSTKLIIKWLKNISFLDDSILDFGCGPGRLFSGYIQQGHGKPRRITAMDQNGDMLARATKYFSEIEGHDNVELVAKEGGREDLNDFPDGCFSTVICWTVLNHVIDDQECGRLLRALCRVSSKRIILCDPVCSTSETPTVSVSFPTKRRMVKFYTDILEDEGFSSVESILRFGSDTHPEAHRATIIGTRKVQT